MSRPERICRTARLCAFGDALDPGASEAVGEVGDVPSGGAGVEVGAWARSGDVAGTKRAAARTATAPIAGATMNRGDRRQRPNIPHTSTAMAPTAGITIRSIWV